MDLFRPFRKTKGAIIVPEGGTKLDPNADKMASYANHLAAMNEGETKDFDWLHYQAISSGGFSSMFVGEFSVLPTIRVMKQMHIQEFWINACTNAIAKQFLSAAYFLWLQKGNGDYQKVDDHALLKWLKTAGSDVENASYINFNTAADIMLTGNAYWYISKDLKTRRRIPAERIDPYIENNKITKYRILDRSELSNMPMGVSMDLNPEEIIHFKYPNPFSPHIGMSPYIAAVLPTLIDKYGREYIIGFFLRGGNTAGIIETDTTDQDQLLLLFKSIMQAFGGRRNMHADKVLPKGATWKGQGSNFGDIKLYEILKENISLFKAASGTNNAALGLGDQNNRATAFAEMEFFWRNTIDPIQFMFTEAITASTIWARCGCDDKWSLEFDNSHIPYLDDFDRKLDQDVKLPQTLTVNERRERLGYDPLDKAYDVLFSEIKVGNNAQAPTELSIAAPSVKSTEPANPLLIWKARESNLQEPTAKVKGVFQKEFGAWEQIVLSNLKNKSKALKQIKSRASLFSKSFAEKIVDSAIAAYDNQMDSIKLSKAFRKKETEQDRQAKLDLLRQRATDVIKKRILESQGDRFVGYTQTAMDRIYDFISSELESGKGESEIASDVRSYFNESYNIDEAYQGQAETIVRTEYGSALAIGRQQFGEDLSTVTNRMSKSWVTMGDKFVRDSHFQCEDESPIEDDSEAVLDAVFSNGLRYPMDADGGPEDVINCRCVIRYEVTEWSNDDQGTTPDDN